MATSLASSLVWGSGNSPTIYLDISYDASRSGADMKYTVYFTVRKPSGTYGYNIYISASFDNGAASWGGYIKNNSTSSWSSYSTNTGSKTVSNKTSGSTKLVVNAYSPNGQSSRDTTWTYYLPVSAAGSNITASDGTLGVSQNITITKQNASFTDTVTYTCGSASGTIATDSTATTIAWTPPITLAQQNTTGNTVSVTLTTTTKSGSTTIQSKTTTITETIPNTSDFLPTATLALSDNNGYASTFGGYIQGESALKATITSSGKQGATITNNVITVDGTNYTGTSPIVLPPFLSSGSKSVTATVTDSRGKTTTTSAQTITVLPYSSPVISDTSAFRCSSNGTPQADGEYVVLTMKSASMTPVPATGTNRNTPTYRVRYKRSTDSNYTTYTWTSATGTSVTNLSTPTSGTGYPISLASNATMEVVFEVLDQFETTQSTRTVAVATKFIDTNDTKTGLAIGQVSTKDGFQVAFDTFYGSAVKHEANGHVYDGVFAQAMNTPPSGNPPIAPSSIVDLVYPIGSIYMSTSSTSPVALFGGTWERIQDTFLLAAGTTYSAGSSGGEATHTLTIDEMPTHDHFQQFQSDTSYVGVHVKNYNSGGSIQGVQPSNGTRRNNIASSAVRVSTVASGGGLTHNNMPPYLAVFMWRRTG